MCLCVCVYLCMCLSDRPTYEFLNTSIAMLTVIVEESGTRANTMRSCPRREFIYSYNTIFLLHCNNAHVVETMKRIRKWCLFTLSQQCRFALSHFIQDDIQSLGSSAVTLDIFPHDMRASRQHRRLYQCYSFRCAYCSGLRSSTVELGLVASV